MTRLLSLLLLTGLAAIPSPVHSADPPPVSLDELVKLYDQFELPCPAKDAPFCVFETGFDRDERSNGGPVEIERFLGFLTNPITKKARTAQIYRGINMQDLRLDFRVRVVPPIPESLSRIKHFGEFELMTAIQCQKLGYKDLAAFLLKKYIQQYRDIFDGQFDNSNPRNVVLSDAAFYWNKQIGNPDRDRKVIIQHLRELHKFTRKTDEEKEPPVIHSLELSLAPRTSKSGTLESLIDDLVDAKIVTTPFGFDENISKRKLLEKGFEIVPLLIEHLGDHRLTRRSFNLDYSN